MRKIKFIKKLAFVIIIDLFIILALEFSLRVLLAKSNFIKTAQRHFDPATHVQPTKTNVYMLDPELFWKPKPSKKYGITDKKTGKRYFFSVNKYGFRGDDYSLDADYDFRILSIGDSCTAGWQVADTYTSELKEILLARYPDKDILAINAGVSGYTSHQILKLLEQNIDATKPDLLLVYIGHNDRSNAILQISDKNQKYFNFHYLRAKKVIKKSVFFLTLYELVYNLKRKITKETDRITFRVDLKDYKSNLKRICLLAEQSNAIVIFVNSPVAFPEKKLVAHSSFTYLYKWVSRYNRAMKETANLFGFAHLVDTVNLAKEMGNAEFFADHENGDIWHPGQKGHRRIAEEIFRVLTENESEMLDSLMYSDSIN